jgi:uncharacterized Ntn-hydrolase superfamily protein
MTWSILARDSDGRFGLAIASRFFAVGALCLYAKAGVGALSTQALMNPLYGPDGVNLLAAGLSARDVVEQLTSADAGASQRQLHLLPATGPGWAHTGSDCTAWCGHSVHEDFSVAGNMLAGPEVLHTTAQAFVASLGQPLAQRLIVAMQAGEAAGGDKRGKQSAALLIQGHEDYADLDLRVDDHAAPLPELQRLYDKSLERYQPFIACLATRSRPWGELDRGRIEAHIERFHAARREKT